MIENYHPDHLTWAIPDEWYTYENALPSLSLCYGSSRKYNYHFPLQRRNVPGFTIHIVCYLLHSYPVECYFSKKSSYSSLPFFFARMISKRAVSSKEKWKSCHLHASPDINNSLSMFTTYIRWHCYSGWFYYRSIWRKKMSSAAITNCMILHKLR